MRRLGGAALEPVMQAAHLRNGNDACQRRWLHGPRIRRVLAERQVRSCSVIGFEIARQRPTERGFAEDNQMIETLPANVSFWPSSVTYCQQATSCPIVLLVPKCYFPPFDHCDIPNVQQCDRQTPSCSQCIRGQRICPGYRNELDLMFRNEVYI